MKIKNIVLSWDFVIAIVLTLCTAIILPNRISLDFCFAVYSIGITVLSIVFSIFFAALAIIMSSSDNDFVDYLEEEGDYTTLLNSFIITLIMLFVSLVFSITMAGLTVYVIYSKPIHLTQCNVFFLIFEFLFFYSLFATGLSVRDTIMFSKYRAKYLKKKKELKST